MTAWSLWQTRWTSVQSAPFTVGRKNWLFSSLTEGAEASVAAFSLIETDKANRLDTYDYMEYLLEAMLDMDFMNDPARLDELMPWSTQIKKNKD